MLAETPPRDPSRLNHSARSLSRTPQKMVTPVADDHKNGVFSAQTDVVERIGGRPPQSLEDFIRNNLAAFGVEERVVSHG